MKKYLKQVFRILYLSVRFFTAKRVMAEASALTYSTLLAIVPILAVVFAIARGFGYNKFIEIWFREALSSQPQAAEAIIGFVNGYLVHTKSGVFLGVGLIFMLYTVLMLMNNVEETFNQIWQVNNSRPIFRSFTNYLAMFLLFPLLLIVLTGVSVFMETIANSIPNLLLLGSAMRMLLDLSSYILISLMFFALYVYMPNTKVRPSCAIIPSILAGVSMQLLQLVYIHSQIWVTGYNAIYGSFAALPLFMLWVQISWTICLFGAELTYTSQNLDYYDYDAHTDDVSHRYQLMISALIMSRICRRYADGKKAPSADELRQETGVPIRIVNDLLFKLAEARLIIEVSSDEKGAVSTFVPAESLSNLSVGTMIDRLEAQGRWNLDVPVADLLSAEWGRAIMMRTNYLRQAQDIPLEDLYEQKEQEA